MVLYTVERGPVPHETGLAHGQMVDQCRPLDGASRALGHVLVVALVVLDLQLAHARRQAGLQEHTALIRDADTCPRLEQSLPLMELLDVHLRQLL